MAWYLLASATFMGVATLATLATLLSFAGYYRSPLAMYSSIVLHAVARVGTAASQLSVFVFLRLPDLSGPDTDAQHARSPQAAHAFTPKNIPRSFPPL